MPKKLEEIKGFTSGIISSPTTIDIPKESASYSLNIDAKQKQGTLIGIHESKILSEKGWVDKRYETFYMVVKEHAGSFSLNNYSDATSASGTVSYFMFHTYENVYLVWLSNNISTNLFKDVHGGTNIQWIRQTNYFPDLIDVKIDITGCSSTAEVATNIITTVNTLGPSSASFLSENVASTWFDVSLDSSYSASPAADTVIKFQSNYLGNFALPSVADSGSNMIYLISSTYFHILSDIEGAGFKSIPEGVTWGTLVHNNDKNTLVFLNKDNRLVFSEDIYSDRSTFNITEYIIQNNGLNKISSQIRNGNLYIGAGNNSYTSSKWFGKISRTQLNRTVDEYVLEDSECKPPEDFASTNIFDKIVVPTLHSGMNSTNSMIAGSASLYASGSDNVDVNFGGPDVDADGSINTYRSLNGWVMQSLANATHAFQSDWSAATDDSHFDWAKSCKRGMIFRVSIGDEGNPTAYQVEHSGTPADGTAIAELRKIKEIGYGDMSGGITVAQEGIELHDGDLFQVVTVPASGTSALAQCFGDNVTYPRLIYVGSLIGESTQHASTNAHVPAPAWAYGMKNDGTKLYRISLSECRDEHIDSENQQETFSTDGATGLKTSKTEFQKRTTFFDLKHVMPVSNFQLGTIAECMSSDGIGGTGGRTGHIKQLTINLTTRVDSVGASGTTLGTHDYIKFQTTVNHLYEVGDWVTISNSTNHDSTFQIIWKDNTNFVIHNKDSVVDTDNDANCISANRNYYAGHGKLWVTSSNPLHVGLLWIVDVLNWHGVDGDNERVTVKQVNLNFNNIHSSLISGHEGKGLIEEPLWDRGWVDQSWTPVPKDSYISGICETYSHQPHLDDGASEANGTGRWRVWLSYSKASSNSSFSRWDLFLFNLRPTDINDNFDSELVSLYDKTPPYQECRGSSNTIFFPRNKFALNVYNLGAREYAYSYAGYPTSVRYSTTKNWENSKTYLRSYTSQNSISGPQLPKNMYLNAGAGGKSGEGANTTQGKANILGMHVITRYGETNQSGDAATHSDIDTNYVTTDVSNCFASQFDVQYNPMIKDPSGYWHLLEVPSERNYHYSMGSNLGWTSEEPRSVKTERHCLTPFYNQWYWTGDGSTVAVTQSFEKSGVDPSGSTTVIAPKVAHIVNFITEVSGRFVKFGGSLRPKRKDGDLTSYWDHSVEEGWHEDYYIGPHNQYWSPDTTNMPRTEQFTNNHCLWQMHDSPVAFAPYGNDTVTGSSGITTWGGNEIQGRPTSATDDAAGSAAAIDVPADYVGDNSKHTSKATIGYSAYNQYRWGHDYNGTHEIHLDSHTSDSQWNSWKGYKGEDGLGHFNMITTCWDNDDCKYWRNWGGGLDTMHGRYRYRNHNTYAGYNLSNSTYGNVGQTRSYGNSKTYTFAAGGEGTGYMTWYANKDSHVDNDDAHDDGGHIVLESDCRSHYPDGSYHWNDSTLNTTTSDFPNGEPWENRRINTCNSIISVGTSFTKSISALGSNLVINPRCTFSKLEGYTRAGRDDEDLVKYEKINSIDLMPVYINNSQFKLTTPSAANVMRPGILISGKANYQNQSFNKIMAIDPNVRRGYGINTEFFKEHISENNSTVGDLIKPFLQETDGYAVVSYWNEKLTLKNLCHSIFHKGNDWDIYSPIITGDNSTNTQSIISTWRKSSWPALAADVTSAGVEDPWYTFSRFYNINATDNDVFSGLDNAGGGAAETAERNTIFPTESLGSTAGDSSNDADTVSGAAGDAGSHRKTESVRPIETKVGTVTTESEAPFMAGDIVEYKFSYLYDGFQDSPLNSNAHKHNQGTALTANYDYFDITIQIPTVEEINLSKRVTDILVWRRNNEFDNFSLVKSINLSTAAHFQRDEEGHYNVSIRDEKLFQSYEVLTGISETLNTTTVNYSISAQVNDFLFVADSYHSEFDETKFIIFRSQNQKFSIFNWKDDFLVMPTQPLALASFGGKLYVFSRENLYRVNPDTLFIENVMDGVGILNQNSVVVTDFGMFFCDANNMYHHDGTQPKPIGDTVLHSQNNPEWNVGYKRTLDKAIKEGITPLVQFDGRNNVVYFIVKGYSEGVSSYTKTSSRAFAYSLSTGRFDYVEMPSVDVALLGKDSDLLLFDGYQIYNYRKSDSIKKSWSWDSKVFDMGTLAVKKVWKSLKISGSPTLSNFSGSSTDDMLVYVDGNQKTMKIENKNWIVSNSIAGFTADQNWNGNSTADTGAVYALSSALPGSGETVSGLTNSDSFSLVLTSMPEFVSGLLSHQSNPIQKGEISTLKYISSGHYLLMEMNHSVTNRSIKEIVKVNSIDFIWGEGNLISRVEVKCNRAQLGTQAFDFEATLKSDVNWEHASMRYIGPSLKFPTGTKGQSMQIKLRNQKGYVESLSIIYRDKTLK